MMGYVGRGFYGGDEDPANEKFKLNSVPLGELFTERRVCLVIKFLSVGLHRLETRWSSLVRRLMLVFVNYELLMGTET